MSVVLPLRGATALSDFRVEKLLQKAAAAGLPPAGLKSEYSYFAGGAMRRMLKVLKDCRPCWPPKVLSEDRKHQQACIYF